jgi:hypothetical protein
MRFQPGFRHSASAVVTFTPPLDTYTGASLAFSFRKLRTAYAGSAVRIRESGGNTEADIGFDGNGNFDAAAAAAHIGANSGFIVTWYDQSGNGFDITQATANNQPIYSASAGPGGKPALKGNDSGDTLQRSGLTDTQLYNTQVCGFIVVDAITAGNTTPLNWTETADTAHTLNIHTPFSGSWYFDFASNASGRINNTSPSLSAGDDIVITFYRDSSDNQAIMANNTTVASGTKTVDAFGNTGTLSIPGPGIGWTDEMSEVILWATDLGASRDAARTDIGAYYGITV